MLDGRFGKILVGLALVTACGTACGSSTDHVGAVAASPDVPTEPPAAPTTYPPPDTSPVDVPKTDDGDDAGGLEASVLGACAGPDRPARCDEDPRTFRGYGAAGLISTIELLGEQSCCADFDDDGEMDNALGEGMSAIGQLERLNTELNESLISGTQNIVLELDGLDDLENDAELDVHVWNTSRLDEMMTNGTHRVAIDRSSIDEGVAPLFSFDEVVVQDGILSASKGAMELEASFNGVWLRPEVRGLHVTARLEAEDLQDGVRLRDGEIAGHIALDVINDQLNGVAEGCDCLGLDGPLVKTVDGGSQCVSPDTAACETAERDECVRLVEVCPVMESIAGNMVDVDTDDDGLADAISLGALFEGERAVITGVTAP